MNVTSTGIAVALAVIVALGFMFFGPGAFTLLTSQDSIFMSQEPATTTPAITGELPTELTIVDNTVGTGEEALPGDTVSVHYVGMLPDGTVFDASVDRGPFSFLLGAGSVIPGWEQGILGMKEGGTRRLVIPPALAYGEGGVPGAIPANATLVFDVQLLEVTKGE